MKPKKEADVRPEMASYPILTMGAKTFLSVVEDNLQGEILSANDLERIRIPTGGGLNWTIPTLDGGKSVPSFEGIILYQQTSRAYWEKGIASGSTPPNCASTDGRVGIGEPGGDCIVCPHAQYGSNPKSQSGRQACRQAKNLFVLLPESYLPLVLVLPPSSLKPFKQFMLQLSAANVPIQEVVVRFGLEKSSNRSNIAFSLATFAVNERLTTDETATISAYASVLKEQGTFDLQSFLASDFNGNGNGKG